MGGYGSGGCHGKPASYAEDCLKLDVVKCYRHCYSMMRHGFKFNHTDHGPIDDSIGNIKFTYNDLTGFMTVTYPGRQVLKVEMLPMLNPKVLRPYIICPACCKRRSALFFKNEFACRVCHQLLYKQQGESRQDRARTTAFRIRERLGDDRGIGDFLFRPRYMHEATYQKWLDRCRRAEAGVWDFMPASLRKCLQKNL